MLVFVVYDGIDAARRPAPQRHTNMTTHIHIFKNNNYNNNKNKHAHTKPHVGRASTAICTGRRWTSCSRRATPRTWWWSRCCTPRGVLVFGSHGWGRGMVVVDHRHQQQQQHTPLYIKSTTQRPHTHTYTPTRTQTTATPPRTGRPRGAAGARGGAARRWTSGSTRGCSASTGGGRSGRKARRWRRWRRGRGS